MLSNSSMYEPIEVNFFSVSNVGSWIDTGYFGNDRFSSKLITAGTEISSSSKIISLRISDGAPVVHYDLSNS